MSNLQILQDISLFKGSTREELELWLGLFQERHVKPDITIFAEKMPAEALYIIKSGSVRISLPGADGGEKAMLLLGPGDFFGELALLQEETRLVNARTESSTELLILTRKDFQALLDLAPRTGAKILHAIAKTLVNRIIPYLPRLKEMLSE